MRRATAAIPLALAGMAMALAAGCSSSVDTEAAAPGTGRAATPVRLGDFPAFPDTAVDSAVASALQAALDEAVAVGEVQGVTAGVITVGRGTWAGAAGADAVGRPLTPESQLPIASVGKTMTAAQVMRLAEQGRLRLDDPVSKHVPPRLSRFDLDGVTIRDLLGMRSGFTDPANLGLLEERGAVGAIVDVITTYAGPPGSVTYANANYYLLDLIVEHLMGGRFADVVDSGVLGSPVLDGLVFGEGTNMSADPASLARWGYELYGGSVLTADTLREMTDFRGEWYGLGAIDFSHPGVEYGYDAVSVGHGGQDDFHTVRLVVFPETGVVVAVQAVANGFSRIHSVVEALRTAALG